MDFSGSHQCKEISAVAEKKTAGPLTVVCAGLPFASGVLRWAGPT
jgi:hypothetical protein